MSFFDIIRGLEYISPLVNFTQSILNILELIYNLFL